MVQHFPEVFQGLGLCNHAMVTLTSMTNARPVFHPKWAALLAALPMVDEELEYQKQIGVLKRFLFKMGYTYYCCSKIK